MEQNLLSSTAPPGYSGSPAVTDLIPSGHRLIGGHIYLNTAYSWNTSGSINQSQMTVDVRTIATHELGHDVYLNHPSACGAMTSAERRAAMNPEWVKRWSTNSDDKAGLAVRK